MIEQTLYKKSLKQLIILISLLFLFYTSFMYIMDPLQMFRAAKLYQPAYTDELYQIPGMVKHYAFDTAIIGTSTSENIDTDIIAKQLGWHAIKLTLMGANVAEENVILRLALARPTTQHVIYGMDGFSFNSTQLRAEFPLYLYQFNHQKDVLQYLFNLGNVTWLWNHFVADKSATHLAQAFSWDAKAEYSSDAVMRHWQVMQTRLVQHSLNYATMRVNFDTYLLTEIKSHPQVTFSLYYPPYSVYAYEQMRLENSLEDYLQFKKYVFIATQNLPNVKIYDFQTDRRITHNLSQYKDTMHFSGKVSAAMIAALKGSDYRVSIANLASTLDLGKYSAA